ncbi:MAG: hypothetical protein HOB39_00960 [Gammaproteobacteria bacterium]|jgi:DNA-directed RNA polymerase sigma subunit (sigma70/sigma32)|nr:hypothetical protein [Gammaproteobacteria bacterium]MBT7830122.1 hypothetical protein [Candidatus Neomarinimicrobiota bacterium]
MLYEAGHSLEEVAEELQKCGLTENRLSRERVRQIEQEVLHKLLRHFIRKGIFSARDVLWPGEGYSVEYRCEGYAAVL